MSTLFMSSAKFSADLPVVQLPSNSNMCSKIPASQVFFSLDAQKRLYMHAGSAELQTKAIELLAQQYGLHLSGEQLLQLQHLPYLSSDVRQLPGWLATPTWKRKKLPDGIPYSAPNDQLTTLLRVSQQASYAVHRQPAIICLRLDARLPAMVVMPFLEQIQAQGINRAILITESE